MALYHDPGWVRWPIATLAAADAGWMLFDGTRALVVGDYVRMGPDGLGPWADLVSAIGVDPVGVPMRLFFVVYGLCWIAVLIGYLVYPALGRRAMAIAAAASVWYMVIGTAVSVVILALLAISPWARARAIAGMRPTARPSPPI